MIKPGFFRWKRLSWLQTALAAITVLLLTACPQESLETQSTARPGPETHKTQLPAASASVHSIPRNKPTPKPTGFASGRPADLVVSSNYRPDVVYSSVIIDARGLGVSASMSPTILSGTKEIFPPQGDIDLDYAVNVGLAAYVYGGIETARQSSRAGKTPLFLRARAAHGRSGSGAVLAEDDGRNLLAASQRSGLLKQFKVIFLLDKQKPD